MKQIDLVSRIPTCTMNFNKTRNHEDFLFNFINTYYRIF